MSGHAHPASLQILSRSRARIQQQQDGIHSSTVLVLSFVHVYFHDQLRFIVPHKLINVKLKSLQVFPRTSEFNFSDGELRNVERKLLKIHQPKISQ